MANSRLLLAVSVLLALSSVPTSIFAADEKQLRFDSTKGQFRILQVADMHYADGKSTPCLDVLPGQVSGCSDLNTTAFLHRMIAAFQPHFIVFTGTPKTVTSFLLFLPVYEPASSFLYGTEVSEVLVKSWYLLC